MQQDRCTGHCCRAFNIGSREHLTVRYQRAKARQAGGYANEDDLDIIQVFEMVIPLPAKESTNWTGNPYEPTNRLTFKPRGSYEGELHTCKHLQDNGDCGNYENRPRMCQDFPNGYACEFVRCTSKEARSLRERVWSTASTGFKEVIPVEALTSRVPIRLKPKTRTTILGGALNKFVLEGTVRKSPESPNPSSGFLYEMARKQDDQP